MGIEEELQEASENGSLVIGREETIKGMDSIDKVVLASNAPAALEKEVREEADEHGMEVEKASHDNVQLGSLCMRPFSASVVAIQ